MSERYPGGFISKNAPTVSTSGAQGVWTLEQQAAYQKAGQWPFGGPFTYVEDVFSAYLYTGNNTGQTITNGIDLSTKGGMVWLKSRSLATDHNLYNTDAGVRKYLQSNTTAAQGTWSAGYGLTAFNTNGFTIGNDTSVDNTLNATYVSWTFRKQPKFFDVVTYTGTGSSLVVNHNLGSTPGCIMIKNYNPGNTDWTVYHRSLGTGSYAQLNNNSGATSGTAVSAVSSTTFTVAGGSANWNSSGQSYVAYVFAHDAGGFGITGNDSIISCGSLTCGSTGTYSVNLGWEPQFILIKRSDTTGGWWICDNHRQLCGVQYAYSGFAASTLLANTADSEYANYASLNVTPTGFEFYGGSRTDIYIAIRRGPMKTPTSATTVFDVDTWTGTGTSDRAIDSGFVDDVFIDADRGGSNATVFFDRLRGNGNYLQPANTNTQGGTSYANWVSFSKIAQTGVTLGNPVFGGTNASGVPNVGYHFGRAPGFMDVVCYLGNGSVRSINHNLGVAPEMIICKSLDGAYLWNVYHSAIGVDGYVRLNGTNAVVTGVGGIVFSNPAPSATTFSVGTGNQINQSTYNYVAYLFASLPGISKVGSYTGTGGTQTISCGFAARFVMIKRTDSTGDWWFWDTVRGMVSGTDPRMAMNLTAAETNTDWVYTDASGFQIVTTDASVNASGGSYIFLAIA